MSRTLFRYVLSTYLAFFAGVFGGLVSVYLVVDFVDRAKAYSGPHWARDVAVLYGFKAALAAQQLGPAAVLLAAGLTVSTLRKRGELIAMQALAIGPTALYLPIGCAAFALALGLAGFDELWVTHASRRVDEIQTHRFDRGGDFRFYNTPKQWFRHRNEIFYLRSGSAAHGFEEVSLFELTPDFQLARRTDARRMEHADGSRWRLLDVEVRTFVGEAGSVTHHAEEMRDLGLDAAALAIRTGRPEQMRTPQLREQIEARGSLGLPTRQLILVLHNRLAYPLIGFPAALVALGLSLRPGRRGHLTAAAVEGLGVALGLWLMLVIGKTLALTGRASPQLAAWLPVLTMLLVAVLLWVPREAPQWRRT